MLYSKPSTINHGVWAQKKPDTGGEQASFVFVYRGLETFG